MLKRNKLRAIFLFFGSGLIVLLSIFYLPVSGQIVSANNGASQIEPQVPPVTAETLRNLNPLQLFSSEADEFMPGGEFSLAVFINRALNIIFPLAGLALFVMIVWGGFEMLTGVAGKQGLEAGKQRVTAAVIGFLLLFASYWIIQIVETITGVKILG